MNFKIIIPDPIDEDNPTIADIEEGVEYWYIDGIDLNQVRIPKHLDLEVWITLLKKLSEREHKVFRR